MVRVGLMLPHPMMAACVDVYRWETREAHAGKGGHPAELVLWVPENEEDVQYGVSHRRIHFPLEHIAYYEVIVYNGPHEESRRRQPPVGDGQRSNT